MSPTSEIFILHNMYIFTGELFRISSANSMPSFSAISLKAFSVTVPILINAFFSLSTHSVASSTLKAFTVAKTNLSMTEILSGYFLYKKAKTLYRIIGGNIEKEYNTSFLDPNSYFSKYLISRYDSISNKPSTTLSKSSESNPSKYCVCVD